MPKRAGSPSRLPCPGKLEQVGAGVDLAIGGRALVPACLHMCKRASEHACVHVYVLVLLMHLELAPDWPS